MRADAGERVFYAVYLSEILERHGENLLNVLLLENGRKNDKRDIWLANF